MRESGPVALLAVGSRMTRGATARVAHAMGLLPLWAMCDSKNARRDSVFSSAAFVAQVALGCLCGGVTLEAGIHVVDANGLGGRPVRDSRVAVGTLRTLSAHRVIDPNSVGLDDRIANLFVARQAPTVRNRIPVTTFAADNRQCHVEHHPISEAHASGNAAGDVTRFTGHLGVR